MSDFSRLTTTGSALSALVSAALVTQDGKVFIWGELNQLQVAVVSDLYQK